MATMCLRLYMQEGMRHGGTPIHDWLFKTAREAGIAGGIAFRASAGFGRHGLLEDTFFELAGDLPQVVEFIAGAEQIQGVLARIEDAGLELVYITYEVNPGVTGR